MMKPNQTPELPETISFADIEISQGSRDNTDNTLITFKSETVAILNNINSAEISQSELGIGFN